MKPLSKKFKIKSKLKRMQLKKKFYEWSLPLGKPNSIP
jgi:hypothetical protein